jgi:hypothetical protein
MKTKAAIIPLILVVSLLAACSSGPAPATPTQDPAPTETPAPTATQTPPPTPTPVPIGGGTGEILYTSFQAQETVELDGGTLSYPVYQLERMNLATGETETLITLDMLEQELGMELYVARFNPSPDGSQVVISVATAITAEGPQSYENYLSDLKLGSLVPILDTGAKHVNWKWSPDGSMLLGDTLIDDSRGILIVNNDGSGLRKVIKSGLITSPIWAPDSSSVYSIILGKPVVTTLDGSESQAVGLDNIDGSLITMSFSPDGERVVYLTETGEVYLAKSDFSEKLRTNIESRYQRCLGDYYPSFRAWSPDSAELIFTDVNCIRNIGKLETDYKIQGDNGLILTEVSGGRHLCGWSPDGQSVFYTEYSDHVELKLSSPLGVIGFEVNYPGASCPTWIQ